MAGTERKGYDGGRRRRKVLRLKIFLGLVSVLLAGAAVVLGVVLWQLLQPAGGAVLPPGEQTVMATLPEEETWKVTEAADFAALENTGDPILDAANLLAKQYNYDAAIELVRGVEGYAEKPGYPEAIAAFEDLSAQCVDWTSYGQITHVFFHSLIVDEELAFGSDKRDDFNKVMTTVDEFKKIMQSMYDRGYVLISLHKIARMEQQADGTWAMTKQPIRLPRGKKPFVLSEDDVCYYEYMTGKGFSTKLCLDENGKVVNEYVERDGSVVYGSYDVLTVLEDFIAEHPDFSYQGSKGILAFTGYDGVLGYRTSDFWYSDTCDYYISNPKNDAEKANDHTSPNPNIEQDKQEAARVAQAIRSLGWELASHSWGHPDLKNISYERFAWDTDMWEREVEPIIGPTDIILYPLGADVGEWMPSSYGPENAKYQKLKQAGFNYFCNVDGAQYWVQINPDNFRQGRRNLDGFMMYKQILHPERVLTSDLFDAETVFSSARPLPVPGVE